MVGSEILKAGAENEINAPNIKAPKSIKDKKPKQAKAQNTKAAKKPKASTVKKGVEPTAPEPVVIVELSLPPLELTLDIAGGSKEINEAALQTSTEEYALAAIDSVLPSANVKIITVTITAVGLETNKYIITVTVEYEDSSVSGEDLLQQLSKSFEGDGGGPFIATLQQASSTIGATVTQGIVATAPTPAPMTAPTVKPIAPPTDNPIAPPTVKPISPSIDNPISPPTFKPITPPTVKPIVPQVPACGLQQTCDSGILNECPDPKGCKIFETAGYCVQPNSLVPPVVCTDDCNCLGTDLFDYVGDYHLRGFSLGCYDDYAYTGTTQDYDLVTNVFKYYTENCYSGACEWGNFDSYRTVAELPSDGTLDVSCSASCETIIVDNKYCVDYTFANEYDYCVVLCYQIL